MLNPRTVDLDELCTAMDSRDSEISWWIEPTTGEIRPHIPDVDGDETPDEDGWTFIPPTQSHDGYRVMEDFVAAVPDRHAAELLGRAIAGRGAFRRFKDTLFDLPELREQWFRFRDARAARSALDWLEAEGLVAPADAAEVRALHPDPVLSTPGGDAGREIAGLARAQEELAVARVLIAEGFPLQAVSHAYDAAFHAAVAALLQRGEVDADHSDVIAAFRRLVVREQGLDPGLGTLLQSLADRRGSAEGSPDALADAAAVVAAIERWIPPASRGDR